MASAPASKPRKRVPAAERRDALIDAAVSEFAHGGLHGTPVERIARHVGVTQPYVFSLFAGKRELFLASVQRAFEMIGDLFGRAAAEFDPGQAEPGSDVLEAMGMAYIEMLTTRREYLMLQHQAYAACDDEVIAAHVRRWYAELVDRVRELSGADAERLDGFFATGMWLNVAAAMGVSDLSAGCEWIRAEGARADAEGAGPGAEGVRPGADTPPGA